MSNTKTGLWSAFGALLGGAAGAYAGRYAAMHRPRASYRGRGESIEDAMIVGGASGAVLGAFVAGAAAGEEQPTAQLVLPPQK